MGKLIVPQRGQPLDVSYMYDIVQALNELQDQVGSTTLDLLKIVQKDNTSNTTKMNRSSAFGITIPAITPQKVEANKPYPVSVTFSPNFKSTPIVVATPFNAGNTEAGRSVSVVLTKVSKDNALFAITFTVAGEATVDLNVFAMGIPF
jgi:hypothetical protein